MLQQLINIDKEPNCLLSNVKIFRKRLELTDFNEISCGSPKPFKVIYKARVGHPWQKILVS